VPIALLAFLLVAIVATTLALVLTLRHMHKLQDSHDLLEQERDVMFGFIHDAGEVFADVDSIDTDLMLKRILFYALRTTHAGAGAIFMKNANDDFRARTISGIFPPLKEEKNTEIGESLSKSQHIERLVRAQCFREGEGLIGEVADLGAPILIADPERDERVPKYNLDFLRVRSLLLVPMRFHQQILGVLAVANRVDDHPFIEADLNLLQALADQASVSVHFSELREALDEKRRIDHDLDVARTIQMSLLPKHVPEINGFELAAYGHPALEVGGDYYDFVPVDDNHLGLAIADVSGKGISGAIMMAMCRSVLRSVARQKTSPAEVLNEVASLMSEDVANDMFISILYMVLNTDTRELVVARAGHERPVIAAGDTGKTSLIDSPGIAMGIGDTETFTSILQDVSTTLNPGDMVVAYTDGVTEAMNERNEEWGMDNFLAAIQANVHEGAHDVLTNVQQRVLRYAGSRAQYDDMTLLAIRVIP